MKSSTGLSDAGHGDYMKQAVLVVPFSAGASTGWSRGEREQSVMATTDHEANEPEGSVGPGDVEPSSVQAAPGCPVVGIGASAGGLAAFEAFFSGMPPDADPGMAFVLVQHLAPDHKSILSELVATGSSVLSVADFSTLSITNNLRPAGSTKTLGSFFGEYNNTREQRIVQIAAKLYF
jgi:hypothetical protein